MTKAGIKKEDYREINHYWIKRLTWRHEYMDMGVFDEFCNDLNEPTKHHESVSELLKFFNAEFAYFTTNTMTLGYPKSTDTERILIFEHAGIEIGYGNPEWGAEPNKLYFIIKHGKRLQ